MKKQIRLIEFFAGYGSQLKAFDYLGMKVESWKTCEWAIKSIQAYKDLHFKDDNTDYSKGLTQDEVIEFLTNKGISANYNEPMSEEQIKRLGEQKQRQIYNNIKASHNLVNIQQVKASDLEIVDVDKYDYLMTYSFPCSLAGTKIFTSDGYKNIEDVTTDDFVLTHNNRFCKVAKTMTRISDHYYKLKGLGVPELYLTEEHPLYVFRDNKFQWVKVKDLKLTDMFSFNINQNENDMDLSKEYLWLLGRYVADGYVNKHTHNSVNFSISFDKEQQFLENIPKNFIPRFKKFKKQVWDYRIADKQLKDICLEFKTGAVNKEIPQWVMDLPKEKLQAFFDGYISGDGHIRKRRGAEQVMFSTTSESLFLGMQQIVAKLYGCLPTCSIRKDARKHTFNDTYNCQFNLTPHHRDQFVYKDKICTKIKHIEKFDEDVPVYNFEVESDNSYTCQNVIVHNCQDLSNAGLGKGMSRDSGTRSGMLWEVERILKELKDSNSPLPKYLLMENVPQVHGENNMQDFTNWCNFLKSIGYTNSWQDLNSKNFGIPQNRERTFMVSILNNNGTYFQFPQPIKMIFRLKDLLEQNVDEKYYLSDKVLLKLNIDDKDIKEKTGIDLNSKMSNTRDIASTIKARYDCGYENFTPGPTGVVEPIGNLTIDNIVSQTNDAESHKNPKCVQVAQLEGQYESTGRVYSAEGISPTVTTCGGGNREPKIIDDTYVGMYNYALSDTFMGDKDRFQKGKDVAGALLTSPKEGVVLKEPRICASRGRNPENPNSREKGLNTEQRIELGPEGISNTLTTVTKDNYLVEPSTVKESKKSSFTELQKQMITEEGNIKRYINSDIVDKFDVGDCADISFPNGYGKGNRVCKQCAPTIAASGSKDNLVVKEGVSEDNLKRQLCNKLIQEGLVKEGDVIRHSYTNSRFDSFHTENSDDPNCCSTLTTRADCIGYVEKQEPMPCPTLDTRCDCLGVVVKSDNKRLQQLVSKMDLSQDNQYMDLYNQQTSDNAGTITTRVDASNSTAIYTNYRIRKLTPRECWRLMGIVDSDYDKVAEHQSNASLYHLAGDSIVTTCLMAIFGKLFNVDYRAKIRKLLEELNPNFDFSVVEPEVICERHNLLDDLLGDF